jgi:hypothetical protein
MGNSLEEPLMEEEAVELALLMERICRLIAV